MILRLVLGLAAVMAIVIAPANAEKLKVVASFSILGDMAARVAGDRIELTVLVGPDSDAHVFQPSPRQARAVAKARLFITNGLGFDAWSSRLMNSTGSRARLVVAAPINLPVPRNPHAWQDVRIAISYVENVTGALTKADRNNAAFFERNSAAYIQELRALDGAMRLAFARIPQDRRRVITTHDAFGFLGLAYGIQFVAPLGISTESQASAKGVAALISQIGRENISAIFVENISDARLIRQIARETGVSIGGKLYSDALSKADGPASTYIAMMRHNAKLLTAAMAKGS